jgi:hypothetical protein
MRFSSVSSSTITITLLTGTVIGLLLARLPVPPAAAAPELLPDVVRAKQFELVSPDGKKAAELMWSPTGPHLVLYTSNGVACFDLGVAPVDKPQILVKDSNNKFVMAFGLERAGQPGLTFYDGGSARTKVGVGPMGHALLSLTGKGGPPRLVLSVAEDGTPGIEAYDKDQKAIWKAP